MVATPMNNKNIFIILQYTVVVVFIFCTAAPSVMGEIKFQSGISHSTMIQSAVYHLCFEHCLE